MEIKFIATIGTEDFSATSLAIVAFEGNCFESAVCTSFKEYLPKKRFFWDSWGSVPEQSKGKTISQVQNLISHMFDWVPDKKIITTFKIL